MSSPTTEPRLGDSFPQREELVARAEALQKLLQDRAPEGESLRRQPDEIIDALAWEGMFQLLAPRRFGGYEAGLGTLLAVTEALGRGDGSAAWLVAVGSVAEWMAGMCSREAQEEVFGSDPGARIAGGSAPAAARRADGGLRVSGRWPYASGSHHAQWASMTAVVPEEGTTPDARWCLAPSTEVRLEKTWRTLGMRGTGSDTWVAEDVFVPDHMTLSMSALIEGTWPAPSDEQMYRLPFVPLATVSLLGPLLGLGRAAFDLAVAAAPSKAIQTTFFARQSDSAGVQIQLAEAALKLKTARLHAYGIADDLDTAAAAGRDVSYLARAEIRAETGYAAQLTLDAMSILLNVHGAGSFAEANPMQQYWRDANTAARHAGLSAMIGYEIYGKALLGVDERISPAV
jgi:alkylation response protein AidB-like acyl-CoA dehydrogenase